MHPATPKRPAELDIRYARAATTCGAGILLENLIKIFSQLNLRKQIYRKTTVPSGWRSTSSQAYMYGSALLLVEDTL